MKFMSPPGIGRWESLRALKSSQLNFLTLYQRLKERFGDVFQLYLPSLRYVVNHPDQIRHVLKDHHANYVKSADYKELKPMLGEGLLISEGEPWKRQRRLMSGEFTHEKIKQHSAMIVGVAERLVQEWEKKARNGETFDASVDMMKITFEVAGKAFFGCDLEEDTEVARRGFTHAIEAASDRIISVLKFPLWFPSRTNRQYRKGLADIDKIVHKLIREKKSSSTEKTDVLSRLLKAHETAEGRLTDQLLRDELVTIMIAGHETTSLALTWTWYLLAQNPEALEKLREELRRELNGRSATADDLPRLRYTKAVLQEALRLFPPVPAVSRKPLNDDVIGGYGVQAGALVSCVPYLVQRDPRFWDKADTFMPERFLEPLASKIVPFSYIPFAAGPRICIGEAFALMEGQLILATLVPRFHICLDESHVVVPEPLLTLRPSGGLLGKVIAA